MLSALDTLKEKFRVFALSSLGQLGASDDLVEKARLLLARDVIILLPKLQEAMAKHQSAILAQDPEAFRPLLPEELREKIFPAEMIAKAFQFTRVFQSLMADLSREEEGDEQ